MNVRSLFAALRRLERDGLIESEWRLTAQNRRVKYFALTAHGTAALRQETGDREAKTAAIATIRRATAEEV